MKEIWRKVTERQKLMLICTAVVGALILYLLLYAGGESETRGLNMTERELRLAGLLSSVAGVGQVEVMIAGESDMPVFSYGSGSGNTVTGSVLICAEGAEDMRVYLQLQQAAAAALNLPAERIEIYPLRREK